LSVPVFALTVAAAVAAGWVALYFGQGLCEAARESRPSPSWITLLNPLLLAPLLEEAAFRGSLPRAMRHVSVPAWVAWLTQLVVFVWLHPSGALLLSVVVGIVATILAVRTHSVWPSVCLHLIVNWANAGPQLMGFGEPQVLLRSIFAFDCVSAARVFAVATAAAAAAAFWVRQGPSVSEPDSMAPSST
jgi:membrane protease YdiL (CAAX protease family)